MHKPIRTCVLAGLTAAALMLCSGGAPALARTHHRPAGRHHIHHKDSRARLQDARQLFAAKTLPAELPTSSIGAYNAGCLAGASELPHSGPTWDAMRLSRNRAWGTPRLIDYIEKLSLRAHNDGWSKVLVGDMSMPRGGPMPNGHASHNIGLDADLWLRPGPAERPLSESERESWGANSVLKIDTNQLDPNVWTPAHAAFVRDAAQDANVMRIFVTPAIKQYLCSRKDANGADSEWLRKLRPCDGVVCAGHDDHIHVRLSCAQGDSLCRDQEAPPSGDGCGVELTEALQAVKESPPYHSVRKKPPHPKKPPHHKRPFSLSALPKACLTVLNAKP